MWIYILGLGLFSALITAYLPSLCGILVYIDETSIDAI